MYLTATLYILKIFRVLFLPQNNPGLHNSHVLFQQLGTDPTDPLLILTYMQYNLSYVGYSANNS